MKRITLFFVQVVKEIKEIGDSKFYALHAKLIIIKKSF